MDQPPAVAFTAFADVRPRATETEIGAVLCAIGAGGTLTFFCTKLGNKKLPQYTFLFSPNLRHKQ